MKTKMVRGIADALDRIGATVVALSLIGTFFTEQITVLAGTIGMVAGCVTVVLCVYNKAKLDDEEASP